MVDIFIAVFVVVVMIGGMCIAREVSMFGKKKGFPINWNGKPWDSFETICAYIATGVLLLAIIKGAIEIAK